MALSDRFRTEALAYEPPSTPMFGNNMHDERQRMSRVFMHLNTFCATQSAKDSLEDFRMQYMEQTDGDIGPLGPGRKVRDKRGVFEKLMGRKGGDK